MLVISRKNGQRIMINDNIVITVVEAKFGCCKLAIEADKDVKIFREEIYYKIKLANLIGKDSDVKSVDSVSNILKDNSVEINDKIKFEADDKDIEVTEKEGSRRIIIKKDNK